MIIKTFQTYPSYTHTQTHTQTQTHTHTHTDTHTHTHGFPDSSAGKNPPWRFGSLVWEVPLEKGMATHFSILAWEVPWTEEPFGLQFTGSQRVRHD